MASLRVTPLLLCLCLVACDPPGERSIEWSYIHPAIVAPSCATASCHSELAETAGLALDDADVGLAELLARQYILPGDPQSPLLYLLEGDERPLMPPDAPLPHADVELIRDWIVAGAAP
jgi:cytochrome c